MKTKRTLSDRNVIVPFQRILLKNKNGDAPTDIYSPELVSQTNYEVFRQTPEQKLKAATERKLFSDEMRKQYGTNWKQVLIKINRKSN